MDQNNLYNSIFFPIADLLADPWFYYLYGGIKILNGDNFTTFGDLFSYTMFIAMLFNPLRQIADKLRCSWNDCR
jgi:hypothetical protein